MLKPTAFKQQASLTLIDVDAFAEPGFHVLGRIRTANSFSLALHSLFVIICDPVLIAGKPHRVQNRAFGKSGFSHLGHVPGLITGFLEQGVKGV